MNARLASLLCWAALVAACAKDAASLAPFPCAADNTCPSGVLCLPGTGCVTPQPDALCPSGNDCSAGLVCTVGRCEPPCSSSGGCVAGRVCSGGDGGVCLAECAAGTSCPGKLECAELWQPGEKACMPSGVGFESSCATEGAACGPVGASAICNQGACGIACKDGAGCPSGQLCTAQSGIGICVADCADGGTCPSGRACAGLWFGAEVGCLANDAGLDSPCSGSGGCGPLGANAVCDLGRCEIASQSGAGCPAGLVPSTDASSGVCLTPCADGLCPSGGVCNGPYASGGNFCLPAGAGVGEPCDGGACAPLGSGAICDNGLCALPCNGAADAGTSDAGPSCPGGFLCSAASGAGSCLPDCTSSNICPAGLNCVPFFSGGSNVCLPPGEGSDQPCSTAASCGPMGTGALCNLGACDFPCGPGQTCPSGRICSSSLDGGTCVVDCTAGETCPASTACQSLHTGGNSGCTVEAVPACASVTQIDGCPIISQCGATSDWTVHCSGGGTCVNGSDCEAPENGTTQCQCQFSLSYACDSQPCSGSCNYPNWSCRPATAEIIGCTDPAINSSGVCNCADGGQVPIACATMPNLADTAAPSCEYVCGAECDLVHQTGCSAGAATKCAALRDGPLLLPTCVAPAVSTVSLGGACSRAENPVSHPERTRAAVAGRDNCAPGLFCSDVGPSGAFTCHKHCAASSDCEGNGSDTACISIGGVVGICVAPGLQCTSGSCSGGCSPYQLFDGTWSQQCRSVGSVPEGSACTDESDCQDGYTCQITSVSTPSRACTQLCNASLPCVDTNLTCQAQSGLSPGWGWCF